LLCTDKALHIRHGAILGVGEILIGLSGNAYNLRMEVLERAYRTLSLKERKIIEDSDNQKKFKAYYKTISSGEHLASVLPEGSDLKNSVKQIIDQVEK
jgi:hypothetical protein